MKKTMYISPIKIICSPVFLLLLFFSGMYAQQDVHKLHVTIAMKIKDGDLKNSLVTIARKDAPFKVLDPGKDENTVELPLGYEYVFTFTKLGYTSQNIYVDTHVPEKRENEEFKKQVFKVELEKEPNKEARSNIKITYSMAINDFDFIKGDFSKNEKVVKKETTTAVKTKTNVPVQQKNETAVTTPEKKAGSKIKDKKVIQQDTKKFTIITVIVDGVEDIYKKEEYDWGGVFFYKNDIRITAEAFESETKE
jgi:hypothetical protein